MNELVAFYQESPTWALVLDTTLKMAFVLGIIFSLAPLIIWAERRQSAMIQDRIGPTRANLRLPPRATAVLGNWPAAAGVALFFGALMALSLLSQQGLLELWLGDVEAAEAVTSGRAAMPLSFTLLFVVLPVAGFVGAALGIPAAWYVRSTGGNITLFGLLHPVADALKFLFKEDFVPPRGDKLLHGLAPILTVVTAIAAFAVIPFADTLYVQFLDGVLPTDGHIQGPAVPMQIASVDMGILFVFAVAGTGIIGAAIAGYSSDNKYALLGGLRAASQMVSYEVTLGLTIVPVFMFYGTLLLDEMVHAQMQGWWGIVIPPLTLSAILFFTASIAETKRIPFDLPESESELVAGYFTEYSGMKFGMFFMGEFVEVIVLAAIFSTLFLGGYDLPFLERSGLVVEGLGLHLPIPHWGVAVLQMLTFVLKLVALIWFQLMVRWTLPRFRYDQLMDVCWKLLLPVSLLNILITGVVILLWGA